MYNYIYTYKYIFIYTHVRVCVCWLYLSPKISQKITSSASQAAHCFRSRRAFVACCKVPRPGPRPSFVARLEARFYGMSHENHRKTIGKP